MYASGNILLLFIAISSGNNYYQTIKHFRSIKFSQILDMHFLKKIISFTSNKENIFCLVVWPYWLLFRICAAKYPKRSNYVV